MSSSFSENSGSKALGGSSIKRSENFPEGNSLIEIKYPPKYFILVNLDYPSVLKWIKPEVYYI